MANGVTVRGLTGLAANFRALDADCHAGVRKAVKRFGTDTRELAKQLCPIDRGVLYSSIEDTYSPSGLVVDVGCNPEAFTSIGEEPYDVHVEYGTETSPAQPFLFPAFEAMAPHFQQDVREEIRASVARASR